MVEHNYKIDNPVSPLKCLFILLVGLLISTLIGLLIIGGIGYASNLPMDDLLGNLSKESIAKERNLARTFILINHLFTFVFPSAIVAWFLYQNDWLRYLGFKKTERVLNPIMGACLMILAIPITGLLYWINQGIPLPDFLVEMESSTNGMIESILMYESSFEIFYNILIIAIIPAIGEELLFRGHLQRQFSRLMQNQQAGIWIAAFFFSAIHMQFEGFLPRLFLGALLGYLFLWTGNILVSIFAHFANNAFQVVGVYVGGEDLSQLNIDQIELPPVWQLLIFITLASLLAYYIYIVNRGNQLTVLTE